MASEDERLKAAFERFDRALDAVLPKIRAKQAEVEEEDDGVQDA